MNFLELKDALFSADTIKRQPFLLAKELCSFYGSHADDAASQELILRALEHRVDFGASQPILDALVREVGLFPYLDTSNLNFSDRLAYEMHRPETLNSSIVFHVRQNAVFQALLAGKNVIVGAPPSFGKSVLIDAIILEKRHANILIVVPTIALIDETRRRLVSKVRGHYKVITHHSQTRESHNIFVLTQERVVEQPILDAVNLLIVDEFYKLNPTPGDQERWARLNEVLYKYGKIADQVYMLGPNVASIDSALLRSLNPVIFDESYRTVAVEIHDETKCTQPLARLVEICKTLTDPTIIFCSSPEKASVVAKEMIAGGLNASTKESTIAADWVAATFHPDWHFTKALRAGIGVHHGRIPRSLGQLMVRAFDQREIRFLVCTSTLIEGVNTKARNMIIFDHSIDGRNIDRFTFNNIQGRSGRMGEYFVGHVFLFHDPPDGALPRIDVPAFSQGEAATASLLMRLPKEDLTEDSNRRLEKYREQTLLPFDLLRDNNIDPERQLSLARELSETAVDARALLQWKTIPKWDELLAVCELIWRHFDGRRKSGRSASSPAQLAYFLNQMKWLPDTHSRIQSQYLFWKDADRAVEKVLDFDRLWAGVHFPRLIRVLNKIQNHILSGAGVQPGDYELFATKVQNHFLPPFIVDLDEYGIPVEVGKKISPYLGKYESLDDLLTKLGRLELERIRLQSFEKILVENARQNI